MEKNVFKTEELVVDILTAARRKFLLISQDAQNNMFATNDPKMDMEEVLNLLSWQTEGMLKTLAKQTNYSKRELLVIYIQVLCNRLFKDDSL